MAAKPPNTKKDYKPKVSKGVPFYHRISFTLFMMSLLFGVLSYYTYFWVINPPRKHVDFNTYWGVYPMDPNPDLSIRPFRIEFSDVVVNDLKERLLHRRPFPPPLDGAGFTYGFNSHFLTRVLDYWQNKYNFVEREEFFNRYPHYITNVQGLDIHYMHVKPDVPDDVKVVPILLLHGWPGSFREFYEMIPILTKPNSKHNFVLEIIAPSLPGFGYSEATTHKGLDDVAAAVIMHNLMERVGHKQYYVHAEDLGQNIASVMTCLFSDHLLGLHSSMPTVTHPLAFAFRAIGSIWTSMLIDTHFYNWIYTLAQSSNWLFEETGYLHIQGTKPDTIGIALTDSPAGLAAYILEKYSTWTNPDNRKASDGNLLNRFELTHLLDNVMVYWVTNSITTSMRIYAETFSVKNTRDNYDSMATYVPTWGIKFKNEIINSTDLILRNKYKNYLHTTVVNDGGHFAAMENPEILANDILDAIATFMAFHKEKGTEIKEKTKEAEKPITVYDFTVKHINGKEVDLSIYKGYVLLIVNVASECGLTDKNYHQLNELHDKYARRGLKILAFPCNQFGGQEPGSSKDILHFTKQKGVNFDIFEKVDVNGDNAHPLWNFLKNAQGGTIGDFIKWNFSKFIVDRRGVPVERLGPNVDPLDLEPYITKYL